MDVDDEEGEEEYDEERELIHDIIAHGMKTGNVNDPGLMKRLQDMREKEKNNPVKKKKLGAFSLRKKEKKEKRQKVRAKGPDLDSVSSDSSDSDTPIRTNINSRLGPDLVNSKPKKPAMSNDTPDYGEKETEEQVTEISAEDETSDERYLTVQLSALCMKDENSVVKEALAEIRQQLNDSAIPHDRYYNLAWRSAFFNSNANEIVTKKMLEEFIDDYASTTTTTVSAL